MSDQTSYSALTLHRSCPQAWHYQQVRGLERDNPEQVKAELEFGNWWHAIRAVDSLERGRALGSLEAEPRKIRTTDGWEDLKPDATRDTLMGSLSNWWDSLTQDYQGVWIERLGSPAIERLAYVDSRWRERWADALAEEHPLAVELFWQRELPASSEGDPHTRLIGFIDEIYWDSKRSLLVIRDHKSHKALASTSSVPDLMDSQLQLYSWGSAPLVKAWGRGPVRAVAYDRVRMSAPKEPKITNTGTLSKSVTDYDLHTYLTWTEGGVPWGEEGAHYVTGKRAGEPKWGRYEAEEKVIAALSDPASRSQWFQRTLTPVNRNLVRVHLQSAIDTAHDTHRTRERGEATGQAARNLTKNCRFCEFQSLCQTEMVGGVGGEYELSDHYLRERKRR